MNINEAFPSKWLRAGDIPDGGDLVLTIDYCRMEELGQAGEGDQKPALYFREESVDGKGLILNKTNATTIMKLYGPDTEAWEGKKIALFATEVDFQGKQTLAIRVRMRAPKSAAPAAAATAPNPDGDDPFDGAPVLCAECGAEVDGNQELISLRKFGRALCPKCQKAAAAAA